MYELSGKIQSLAHDFGTQKATLMLAINESHTAKALFDELHAAEKLSIKIEKYRDKRSKEANKYMWHLCDELAKKLSTKNVSYTKEDIYRKEIKDVGVWYDDEVEPDKVEWRRKAWELIGTGWFTERVDFTADGSKEIIRFYYGSSRYNTKQMSRLIDNLVQDCQEQGIQTMTPNEIARLKSLWKEGE